MTNVLFACVHNAGRSQMAAAFFNRLADSSKAQAISAGTAPGPHVHAEVVAAMLEEGIDLSTAAPQRLTADVARDAHWLVTMGCGEQCPALPGTKREDWPLDDPRGRPLSHVRAIREQIRERVAAFISRNGWMAPPTGEIRLASPEDAPAIAAIYAAVVRDTAISFETEPPDERDIRQRIADTLAVYPWLVDVRNGRVAGYAYASRHRPRAAYQWSVDTAVYVGAEFRRQGIGRGLYLSLFAILEAQGVASAFAGIALPNPASVSLHEAVGFTPVGVYRNVGYKLGAWRDVAWFQRPVGRIDVEPQPIRTVQDIRGRDGWLDLLRRGEDKDGELPPLERPR